MKFYNRIKEIEELRRIQGRAFDSSLRMTVITGRRRIGKTMGMKTKRAQV